MCFKDKRSLHILSRLSLLNKKSLEEGLYQLLIKTKLSVREIFSRRRSLLMVLFMPKIKDEEIPITLHEQPVSQNISITVDKDSPKNIAINIVDKAKEFCMEHKLDCDATKVFINNIDFKVKQRDLWDFFEYFGKVLRCTIIKDRQTKRSRGFAFVIFSTPLEAKRALEAKRYELQLNGRLMTVEKLSRQKKHRRTGDEYTSTEQRIKDATAYYLQEKNKEKDEDGSSIYATPIDQFCDEILFKIFSHLDVLSRVRCELVCKRWQNLSIESWTMVKALSFPNIFHISERHAALTDRILISILKKGCDKLISLDLSASPFLISNSSLMVVGNTCGKLEEINLSRVPVQNKTLKHLGKTLLNLQKIVLIQCVSAGEKGFWWLFKDLKYLKFLQIVDSSRLSGKCLYMLPPTVEHIDFHQCCVLSDLGLQNLSSRCPNITSIDLSYCISITNTGLIQLLQTCCGIETLKLKALNNIGNITNDGFAAMRFLKGLVELDVSQNRNVNDFVLQTISGHCKLIKKLNIEACHGDISCEGIASIKLLEELEELNVSYLDAVCNGCISHISALHQMTILTARACNALSCYGVLYCVCYLDQLSLLDASGCRLLDDGIATDEFFSIHSVDTGRTRELTLVVGGTEITDNCSNELKKKIHYLNVHHGNYSVGMLKRATDPTLYGPYVSDDDDYGSYNEKEELVDNQDLHLGDHTCEVHEPLLDSPNDEDDHPLWEVVIPETNHDVISEADENDKKNNIISNLSDSRVQIDGENWDDEITEKPERVIHADFLDELNFDRIDDNDDFLLHDDISVNELIG